MADNSRNMITLNTTSPGKCSSAYWEIIVSEDLRPIHSLTLNILVDGNTARLWFFGLGDRNEKNTILQ